MPYPIFKNGITGGELLILGTKKAKDLVKRQNDLKKKKEKPIDNEIMDEEVKVTRRWIPKQITKN